MKQDGRHYQADVKLNNYVLYIKLTTYAHQEWPALFKSKKIERILVFHMLELLLASTP